MSEFAADQHVRPSAEATWVGWAHWYGGTAGWAVFPGHHAVEAGRSCSKGPACSRAGKHPRTQRGLLDATTDPRSISEWGRRFPAANVCGRTGAVSGIDVLDIDPRTGGLESLKRLLDRYGPLPRGPWSRTGSGGGHLFFRATGVTKSRSSALGPEFPGLDVKGEGGYVVLPPSNHVEGSYVWHVGPDEADLPEWPSWLLELQRRRTEAPDAAAAEQHVGGEPALGSHTERAHELADVVDEIIPALRRAARNVVRRRDFTYQEQLAVVVELARRARRSGWPWAAQMAVWTEVRDYLADLSGEDWMRTPASYPAVPAQSVEAAARRLRARGLVRCPECRLPVADDRTLERWRTLRAAAVDEAMRREAASA